MGKCCRLVYQRWSKGRDINIMKHATSTKRVKLQDEKKPASSLKSMQSKSLSKYLWNVLRFLFHKNNFFARNKIVLKTSSVSITDPSSVHCFDQYVTYDALRDLKQLMQFLKEAGWLRIINNKTKVTWKTPIGKYYF